jgi:ATP-dependent RNA helicase RhlE
MPKQMEELSRAYLTDPQTGAGLAPGQGRRQDHPIGAFPAQGREAREAARDPVDSDPDALTLVFARTKHGAEKLMKGLVADGFNAASIHGNKSQGQRDRAIKAFRDGTDQRAGGHRCGRARHRHSRRGLCDQLRPARGARQLRPPHRPHRARRARGRGDRLLRAIVERGDAGGRRDGARRGGRRPDGKAPSSQPSSAKRRRPRRPRAA